MSTTTDGKRFVILRALCPRRVHQDTKNDRLWEARMRRREFIHSMAVLPPLFWKSRSRRDVGTMRPDKDCDVAVIGSGVFGAWTAYSLNKRGKRVLLLDAHGPGNSRASSGGESRVIRM